MIQLYFNQIYYILIYCITTCGASNQNVTNLLGISQKKLVWTICGADRMDSARILIESTQFKRCVCLHGSKLYFTNLFQRIKTFFLLPYESQRCTRKPLNQGLKVSDTYSTQFMQSFTHSDLRVFNTGSVNIRRC